jgi:hypothetical protein
MLSHSSSHTSATNPSFKVMLVGNTKDKTQITDLLNSDFSYSYTTDFYNLKVNGIRFQIWNLSADARFRTITTRYYKMAHAIIIFSNDEADFVTELNVIKEMVPFESSCGIGVVSSNEGVLDISGKESLFLINSNTSLNAFFESVFTRSQQKRILLWQANRMAEYYNAIIRGLTLASKDNTGKTTIADLILQYALPSYTTYDRTLIQQTDIENQFQALINEAARIEDPILQIRIYVYYKQAHDFASSIAHLHLVNQYISDIKNPLVNDGTMTVISNFLQEQDEADIIQTLAANYRVRQHRIEALQNNAPLPQQGLLFSLPIVPNSFGLLAPDEKAEMRPDV